MRSFKGFHEFLDEGLERSGRAAEAVRARHEKQPFESRAEIQAAFDEELQIRDRPLAESASRQQECLAGATNTFRILEARVTAAAEHVSALFNVAKRTGFNKGQALAALVELE